MFNPSIQYLDSETQLPMKNNPPNISLKYSMYNQLSSKQEDQFDLIHALKYDLYFI